MTGKNKVTKSRRRNQPGVHQLADAGLETALA